MMCRVIPLLVVAIGAGSPPEGVAMDDVVRGNNRFAFELLGKVGAKPGNLIVSPYSISSALAMTSLGARGATLDQMAATLHLPSGGGPATETAFAALHQRLDGPDAAKRPYRLAVANALWGQRGLDYRPEFLRRAEAGFGAGLRPVDFLSDPAGSRLEINAWVEAKTGDKIKDLLSSSDITPGTDLILTNAIYFKGTWTNPFPKSATHDQPFSDGTTSKPVPTMHRTGSMGYFDGGSFQALDLPYAGDDLSMVILLPKPVDGLPALEAAMTAEAVDGWLAKLARTQVRASIPRFKVESAAKLSGPLASLGMKLPFSPEADFSGMAEGRPLHISAVVHKAFAEVNEEGTEAAAATGVVMTRSLAMAAPTPLVVFQADHPFSFLIRDLKSGSILFVGRVTVP